VVDKKTRLINFIIGNQQFSQKDKNFKYRYTLLMSMLFTSIVLLSVAMILRVTHGYIKIAIIDLSAMLFATYFYINLRKNKNSFKKSSNFIMATYYILFTLILFSIDSDTKLIWFANLILAAYLLRGYRYGFNITMLSVSTIVLANTLYPYNLNLNSEDLLFSIVSYLVVSTFLTFSEIEHRKNLISIKKSSKKEKIARKMFDNSTKLDPITNMPNKIALQIDIKDSNRGSLILMAIDDYDLMQDQFGEEYMNSKLIDISNILKSFEKNGVRLYHIFENRFAFFIDESIKIDEKSFAQKINRRFEDEDLDNSKLELSINFTTVIVKEGQKSLSKAILTLNRVEKSNSSIMIYEKDEKQEEIQKNNLYWNRRLPQLIKEDMIVPYFQPIVDNSNSEIVKYEALVRALDNGLVISPYQFLQTAKSKGLLTSITKIVIDKSFSIFKDNSYDISINISEDDLKENYLKNYLQEKLIEYSIDPKRVYLEVLENINSDESNYANEQFNNLKEIGINIAIDDFGAEASNFSRLMTLKADIIKIDGQFIKNLDRDLNSHKIVEAIVTLSKKLGAKTVAEFVHSKDIYNVVKMLGIDYSQGFYFSEPISMEDMRDKELVTF